MGFSEGEKGPRAFILDFDGTITVKDTIGALANFGIEWQRRKGVDMRGAWKQIVGAYGREFEEYVEGYKPEKEERRTVEEEVRYLKSLRGVEERSFERVSESGLFKGIEEGEWEDAGRRAVEREDVVVRRGFGEFVERVIERGGAWGVVSVNFSGAFIRVVVGAKVGPQSEEVKILSNSPDEKGFLVGPKSEGRVVATSDAKLASMKDLLKSWREGRKLGTSRLVYIGDSGTDIECLLEAGVVGIVMSETGQTSLIDTMRWIGVKVVPIGRFDEDECRGKILYWAQDFDEILQSPLLLQS